MSSESTGLSGVLVLLFAILALAWGLYTAGSVSVIEALAFGGRVNLADFFNPLTTQGPYLAITSVSSPVHNAARYFYLASLFFVAVGIIALLIGKTQMKFTRVYRAFALASAVLFAASAVVPYLASSIGTDRLLHLSLIFLAPFAVIGAIACFRALDHIFNGGAKVHFARYAPAFFAVFVVVFFMFNNGLIYEITNDNPQTLGLDQSIAYPIFNQKEVAGGQWLVSAHPPHPTNGNPSFYADSNYYQLFMRLGVDWPFVDYPGAAGTTYTFLGTYNLDHGVAATYQSERAILFWTQTPLGNLVNSSSKIYDNRGANVLF